MKNYALIETFRVGLLLTERCNIACSHCWFGSGPDREAQMTLEEAAGYIDQAREIPTVEWISFTGGEPFLLPETLASLVGYASERGFHTECVTNCFWAETKNDAFVCLEELMGAGLDAINISADDFHQRHIPFERVGNCYEAAKSLGLKIIIMCASAKSSKLRIRDIAKLLGEEGIHVIGEGRLRGPLSALAVETGFVPVGRGAEIPEEEWLIGEGAIEGPCGDVLRDVGIAPSGRVLPCCSAAGQVEEATLGNARVNGLREIVESACKNPVFRALSRDGPAGLAESHGVSLKEGYVNRCHLCYDVLSDRRIRKTLRSYQSF
ncbi:MAG: radical SAM/SPASM domain-containing protein [Candidatus Bathyarchaeia archaeon]